jgi:hypothetical protein
MRTGRPPPFREFGAVYAAIQAVKAEMGIVRTVMRRSTALALVACGAILVLVDVQLVFLNLKYPGLVLVFAGLAGLRARRRPPGWVRARRDQLRDALERFDNPPPGDPRVPLDAILQSATDSRGPREERA